MYHGVTFNFGSAQVCSPAIFETCFSCDKDIWIAITISPGCGVRAPPMLFFHSVFILIIG